MAWEKTKVASEDAGAEPVAGNDSSAASTEPKHVRLAAKLKPKKRIVLDALAAGKSAVEAAELANVDQATVSRWRNHDPAFIAALNARNLDNIKESLADVRSLFPLATAALRKDLEKGNGWLALQFIREAKSLGVFEVGPTSAQAVKEELKLAQQIHEAELMKKQVQLQEQQHELEKIKEKLAYRDSDKKIEGAKEEGYWYAWMAFYRHWSKERDDPIEQHNAKLAKQAQESRQDDEEYSRARCEWPEEKSRQLIEEADRLQQQDQEKKQRGLRVKPAAQQANELLNRDRRLHDQRIKERDRLEQRLKELQPDQPGAKDQRPVVQQQSSTNEQPASDSRQHDAQHGRDEQHRDVEHEDVEPRAVTDDHPAAEQRPADDSAKSNPDVEPLEMGRSEQDSRSNQAVASDPDVPKGTE